MGLDDIGWTGFQSGLSWLAVFADTPQPSSSSPLGPTSAKKGVTVIEGIKTDKNDGWVGSDFSVVTRSITAMPIFAADLHQNACMLAAR
jgi:hypothetical protein